MQRWIINKQFWWLGILEVPTPPPTLTTNTIRSTPPPDYKVVYILDRACIHHRCRSKHSTPGPFHSFHRLGSPSSLPIALLSLFKDPHIHLSFISSLCRHAIMTELMWQNTWLVKYPPPSLLPSLTMSFPLASASEDAINSTLMIEVCYFRTPSIITFKLS